MICHGFLSVFSVESFFTLQEPLLPIKSANLLEYFKLTFTTVALPLSTVRIMILLSSCSDLIASHSDFERFSLGGFDFLRVCLTLLLCALARALGIKAASSISEIWSKQEIPLDGGGEVETFI